ncbi:MAG: hypothetical protein ACKN9K_13935, partial [Dolichospermum sp.]
KKQTREALQQGTQNLNFDLSTKFSPFQIDPFQIQRQKTFEISVIAYYQSNRNLNNLPDIEKVSDQLFDRFDSFKKAFHATANFTRPIAKVRSLT